MLNEVIDVRRNIGDPIASDFIVVDDLPLEPFKGIAYTTGDGIYSYFNGLKWQQFDIKFTDNYIERLISERGKLRASIRLIDNLIALINPDDYIAAGNTGGQSMSFSSLAEVVNYYEGLRRYLLDEEAALAGADSGRMLKTVRKPVGGVLEDE